MVVIPGWGLKLLAYFFGALGGAKFGIHPDRVKKLMISTNICGLKLFESGYKFRYGLEKGIRDWYEDNQNSCLI